jgi:hypothetical protein
MYSDVVKTITITIPEDLDAAAATEAKRLGTSKSELIRRGLRAVLPVPPEAATDDPWTALAGFGPAGVSTEPGEIDRVLYDR